MISSDKQEMLLLLWEIQCRRKEISFSYGCFKKCGKFYMDLLIDFMRAKVAEL